MIKNPVKHQMIPAFKVFDIRPRSQIGINGFEIGDRKSPVGGVREKGEKMKRIDGPFEICVTKFGQICEGGALFTAQEIPVSDHDDIFLSKSLFRIKPLFLFYQCLSLMGVVNIEYPLKFRHVGIGHGFPVKEVQAVQDPFSILRRDL